MAIEQKLHIGNILGETKFGKKRSEGKTFSRLEKDEIRFAVSDGKGDTAAFLTISTLKKNFWDSERFESVSPIFVRLTDFVPIQVEVDGQLEEEIQTVWDEYWLDRRHGGEDYGGQLWIHRRNINGQDKFAYDGEKGNLPKYRNAIELALDQVPGGSVQWHRIDDVLSFIDGKSDK
jgi:hypothetical protein